MALIAGCGTAAEYPQSALHPLGDFARMVDQLFTTTVRWATLVFVLVEGALLYAIFRFRGSPTDAEPEQVHGNTTVEIVWTIIPALILAMIAVPTVRAIFKTNELPGKDALTVEVIGHQWWWEFRYPEFNLVTANELHVPVGRTVSLRMGSGDVIHSFWIPQFAGKRDVFPNRETRIWFKADQAGNFPGQCAEFCGIQHGKMAFRVIAMTPDDFNGWVQHMGTLVAKPAPAAAAPAPAPADSLKTSSAGATIQQSQGPSRAPEASKAAAADTAKPAPQDPQVAQGEKLFAQKGCIGCHSLVAVNPPKGLIGPNLANVGARTWIAAGTLENTDANLAAWIRNPQQWKKGVLMPNLGVTEDEAKALVAYLRTHR
ncbi:MAG TPA: cytochrome c oxidase subunit II [Gemmatimonadales bacterium]|nr:cytochrome c oxidase subunit II [Gemmatimonadales bacterium]